MKLTIGSTCRYTATDVTNLSRTSSFSRGIAIFSSRPSSLFAAGFLAAATTVYASGNPFADISTRERKKKDCIAARYIRGGFSRVCTRRVNSRRRGGGEIRTDLWGNIPRDGKFGTMKGDGEEEGGGGATRCKYYCPFFSLLIGGISHREYRDRYRAGNHGVNTSTSVSADRCVPADVALSCRAPRIPVVQNPPLSLAVHRWPALSLDRALLSRRRKFNSPIFPWERPTL